MWYVVGDMSDEERESSRIFYRLVGINYIGFYFFVLKRLFGCFEANRI